MLVLRRLISHKEGQADLPHQNLAICKSVSSRCIEFSDCLEDYAQASLMHLSGSNANISLRCPCICCCLSRIHRQTSPEAKSSFLEPCTLVNVEQGHCQYSDKASKCCKHFAADKNQTIHLTVDRLTGKIHFHPRTVLENN